MDEIESRHARAAAEGRDTYIDPETGCEVFTSAYLLRRGTCCGAGCRHCPFDYVNVEPAARPAARIVSLLPSTTEIVCALGAGDRLVGISHECDFPPSVRGLPVLTRPRIDASGTSCEIDAAVRSAIREALSVYAVDSALLASLAPDLVLTQDLCEVCAVSLDDVRSALARLVSREDVCILSLRPTRLRDVLDDVVRVSNAIGLKEAGAFLRGGLEARIGAIEARSGALPSKPRVVTLEWIDPLMIGGTWMPELVASAGGDAVGAAAEAPAPTIRPEDLRDLRPDVVVIKPCGFDLDRTLREQSLIERTVLANVAEAPASTLPTETPSSTAPARVSSNRSRSSRPASIPRHSRTSPRSMQES